jgi:hypothetical protein
MKGYIHHDITAYDPKIKVPLVGRVGRNLAIGLVISLIFVTALFALLNRVLHIPHYPSALAAALFAFPFGYIGAFKRQGMGALEYFGAWRTWKRQTKPLVYAIDTDKFSTFERKSSELIIIGKK